MRNRNVSLLLLIPLVFACALFKTKSTGESERINLEGNERIKLPANVEILDADYAIYRERESRVVIELPAEYEVYIGAEKSDKAELKSKLENLLKTGAFGEYEKNVPIKADRDISYGNIVDILTAFPRQQGLRFNLVVKGKPRKSNQPGIEGLYSLEVRNDCGAFPTSPASGQRPNPNTLIASLRENGIILLNSGPSGLDSLTLTLDETFRQREITGVFREGTNEIEKTVIVMAPRSARYDDVIRLIQAVYLSGAFPICAQIDDLEP